MKNAIMLFLFFILSTKDMHSQAKSVFIGGSLANAEIDRANAFGYKLELGFQKCEFFNERLNFTSALTYGNYNITMAKDMARLDLTAYGLKNDISYNFIDKKIFKMFIGTGILLNYTTATTRSYDFVTFENSRRGYDLSTAGINALAGFAIISSKGA